ncbi:DUF6507 family protein [Actinomadura sp. WAC 06369]|uniref:DUF6507 family protein n=1 Tax=Actinomadura sp. WAC 06369 TaxID=2203193 RepID=UPI000F7A32FF|nr:DUF6507 family protein [Actinomadura sp. WAC 06369]RSN52824.1 hypothetical protein DMH08_28120 [Actinomadura sp. WAC 06369]
MTIRGWDISVPGVRSAIARTMAAAEPLPAHDRTYRDALVHAGDLTRSDRIKAALAGFGTHHQYTLALAVQRTSNCIEGVTNATNAYLRGDQEMAEEAQRSARVAPTSADLPKPGE